MRCIMPPVRTGTETRIFLGRTHDYRKADTLLELYRTDKQVIGCSIELYGQVDGNMTGTEVGEAEF